MRQEKRKTLVPASAAEKNIGPSADWRGRNLETGITAIFYKLSSEQNIGPRADWRGRNLETGITAIFYKLSSEQNWAANLLQVRAE